MAKMRWQGIPGVHNSLTEAAASGDYKCEVLAHFKTTLLLV
jgi:hypothetical protein